jgi:DNA-binding CsgD family transcriptional regulator
MNQRHLPGGSIQAERQSYLADDILHEMLRYVPVALFVVDIEKHFYHQPVKINFFNKYFYGLTEFTQDEINLEGFDHLNQLIYYQDHRIVKEMFRRLMAKGMFASVSRAFRIKTRNETEKNVICCLSVTALHEDKSLKRLCGCLATMDKDTIDQDQLTRGLKQKISPKDLDIIKDITACEMMVLKLISIGCTDSLIAAIRNVQRSTIISIRRSLLSKTGQPNRAALCTWATKRFLTGGW